MASFRLAALAATCLLGVGAIALAQPPVPSGPGAPAPSPGTGPGAPGGAPAGAPGGPGSGDDPYFRYRVCNKSSFDAFIAVSNRLKPGTETWRSHGWYTVARGQCIDVGTFPRGWFYWYGRDREGGSWAGQGADADNGCVDFNAAFDFTFSDTAGSCPAGFSEVFFKKVNVNTPVHTSTLND
jgi:uncharacterized membrane protein